jgi:hypothetical protein
MKFKTATRTVYQTERIRIDRVSDRYGAWFQLYLDSEYVGNFERQHEAEHEAALWLAEQAQYLAVYA